MELMSNAKMTDLKGNYHMILFGLECASHNSPSILVQTDTKKGNMEDEYDKTANIYRGGINM